MLVVLICGCGGMEPILVGEQNDLRIGTTIWILHPGHNNEVLPDSIARPHNGSRGSAVAHLVSLCCTGQQMVMVTKVIREDIMVLFDDKVEMPVKITTLDVSHQQQIRLIFCVAHCYWWKNGHDIGNGVNKQWSLVCKVLFNSIFNFMSHDFIICKWIIKS